jgi:tRNA A22 N-methylase
MKIEPLIPPKQKDRAFFRGVECLVIASNEREIWLQEYESDKVWKASRERMMLSMYQGELVVVPNQPLAEMDL